MFGLAAMVEVREKAAAFAAGFDPAVVSAADAEKVAQEALRVANMMSSVAALATRRAAEAGLWRQHGERSPA
ncbi:MAG: hypothetical protein ACRD0N_15255, partial [Acidimicrobiales bacterium]